jgi:hypothetical protein
MPPREMAKKYYKLSLIGVFVDCYLAVHIDSIDALP